MDKKRADVDKQTPDSTTKGRDNGVAGGSIANKQFREGEGVLVILKDSRFYFGTVVKVCLETRKCLVKFADGTDRWSPFSDLSHLSVNALSCVSCKSSHVKKDNDIIVCGKCDRGYHQKCHQPVINSGDVNWKCRRCKPRNLKFQPSSLPVNPIYNNSSNNSNAFSLKTVSSTSKECSQLKTSELPYGVCIKSATSFHTERSVIERRIQRQQEIQNRKLKQHSNSRKSEPSISSSETNIQVASNTTQPELPPTPPLSVSDPETPQSFAGITNGAPPTPLAGEVINEEESNDSFVANPNNNSNNKNRYSNSRNSISLNEDRASVFSLDELFCGFKEECLDKDEEIKEVKPQITLPLSLKRVIKDRIARPMKRHLSEKDIFVTETGEVKRRRRRRSSVFVSYKNNKVKLEPSCSSSNSTKKFFPSLNNNSKNLILDRRCSRSVSTTPVKPDNSNNNTLASSSSTNDLKSCVYSYFGAANRISTGECYTVLGKRKNVDGQIQYLIEWQNTDIL